MQMHNPFVHTNKAIMVKGALAYLHKKRAKLMLYSFFYLTKLKSNYTCGGVSVGGGVPVLPCPLNLAAKES
jgi:hypothetical protein